MKTKTSRPTNLMNRSPLRAFLFIPFVLVCFAISPAVRAVCQQGCDLGNSNTLLGDDALTSNTLGTLNTATGAFALLSNTTASNNTASGAFALANNTTGSNNTASGGSALISNVTGVANTATGFSALFNNTTASDNTATGFDALLSNTTGNENTATGTDTLLTNTTGSNNTANGVQALSNNTTGGSNTAHGWRALVNNTTGSFNVAFGASAGANRTSGNRNIDIGNLGVAGESNHIRIGTRGVHTDTFVAGINGVTVPNGVGVVVNPQGHLGTIVSSERFKDAVEPMDKASEAILALKPVTFCYKKELDPDRITQFGLVAEEVEKVNPNLVARDDQGKPYTVRYEAVNAMLLNEFLKEHRKGEQQDRRIEQLDATVAKQQEEIERLSAALKDQAAQIQKVSAQVETSKPVSKVVLNTP